MIVVIEGPRCTGKTTLAEQLVKDLEGIYFLAGPAAENEEIHHQMMDKIEKMGRIGAGLIFDTLHITAALRGKGNYLLIERILSGHNTILIVLIDNPIDIESRLQKAGEEANRIHIATEVETMTRALAGSEIEIKGTYALTQFFCDGDVRRPTKFYLDLVDLLRRDTVIIRTPAHAQSNAQGIHQL